MAGNPAFVCSLQLILHLFPITGIAVCCAGAASGHAAALASSVTKSRRLMSIMGYPVSRPCKGSPAADRVPSRSVCHTSSLHKSAVDQQRYRFKILEHVVSDR
jgi:hypothetical protein